MALDLLADNLATLMSRAFFSEASDALRGFLPKSHRDFRHTLGGQNLKVWFASWHEHYEIQAVSRTALRAAGIKHPGEALEIGFHAEHPRPDENEAVLARIAAREQSWRKTLGGHAEAGGFVGRREIRDRWRRVSELWEEASLDEDGTAIEAAERLATYIRALEPVIARAPDSKCACWKAQI